MPNYLNANNIFLPPNKKARLSSELLPTLKIVPNNNDNIVFFYQLNHKVSACNIVL